MQKPTERITSRQNALLSRVTSLAERKYRRREGLFRFDGRKLFLEALQKGLPLHAVLLRESEADEVCASAAEYTLPSDCRAVILPDDLFDRISEEKSPDGVICVSKTLDKIHKIITIDKWTAFSGALAKGHTMLLESVRDPGNLGTVIRCAAAFGVANLVLSADCADLYHARTVRAAMGTLFTQRILIVEDTARAVAELAARGDVYAAALDETAQRLGAVRFGENDTVVVGNEGHGISAQVLQACTHKVYIPMCAGVESLNAGMAASVLLWELGRQNLT